MNFHEQFQAKKTNILFLDTSSTCTGYAIATCLWDTRTAVINRAGVLWLPDSMTHNEKYHYIQKAIEVYFYVVQKIDYLVHEMYSINPNRMTGVMVVPELIGAVKASCQEIGIKSESILPQTWRKHLEVKPSWNEGKKDYKEPVKQKILSMTDIPDKVVSNITKKERTTPSDLYDAIGIAYGWLKKLEGYEEPFFRTIKIENLEINPHISYDLKGDMNV